MEYKNLFRNGSLNGVKSFVQRIVYDGLGASTNKYSEAVVLLISGLIVIFCLYKLVGLVGKAMKFILSCLEW